MENILTISELNKKIKFLIEQSFPQVIVQGEISNFKAHYSGHWYFSVKDENSQINCVMWKGRNSSVYFSPQDGMKVIIVGKVSVYEVRGNYQLDAFSIQPLGVGELQIAFEKLKNKLLNEGLFDEKYKKKIPLYPVKIGIVTSKEAAAFKDVLDVFKRRYPIAQLFISHTQVQGANASLDIKNSLELLNNFDDIEVIIICRGGGSIEDLWAFNEEVTARAIFKSKIPVVCGVGHEVDVTIADYVADLRAATPTAAAELITPDLKEITRFLDDFENNIFNDATDFIHGLNEQITAISKNYSFSIPTSRINSSKQKLDYISFKFCNSFDQKILNIKNKILSFNKTLELSNPQKILEKGFAFIKQNDKIITDKNLLLKNEKFIITFKNGDIAINETEKD